MNKVYQTKFGQEGNCFQACLASILETSIEIIPDFREGNGEWYLNYKKWLREQGIDLLALNGDSWPKDLIGLCPQVYSIASGKSPRGFNHSTVYFAANLIHDPHPEGGGVKDIADWIYVVPVNPKLKEV